MGCGNVGCFKKELIKKIRIEAIIRTNLLFYEFVCYNCPCHKDLSSELATNIFFHHYITGALQASG